MAERADPSAGLTITGPNWTLDGGGYGFTFDDAESEALAAVFTELEALGETPEFTVTLTAQSGDTVVGPLPLEPGWFVVQASDGIAVGQARFEEVIEGLARGVLRVTLADSYADGCGGELVTELVFAADFALPQAP